MAIKCPKCGSANPDNARYCWNDGTALATQTGFHPFRFRGGAAAASLMELGAQVDKNWDDGKYHLYRGDFANWLSGIGRGDLASAARDIASQEQDEDIGLEKFLQSFGPDAPPSPQLVVNIPSINFGRVDVECIPKGKYTKTLNISNAGRGHLYGTAKSTQAWLQIDKTDFSDNHITITATAVSPARRANIIIQSNGGTETISVTINPVHPWWKLSLIYSSIGAGLGVIRLIIALIRLAVYYQTETIGMWFPYAEFLAESKPWFYSHLFVFGIIGVLGGAIWGSIKWHGGTGVLRGFSLGTVGGGIAAGVIGFILFALGQYGDYIIHPLFYFIGGGDTPWVAVYCWGIVGFLVGTAVGVTRWLIKIRRPYLYAVPAAAVAIIFFSLWLIGNVYN